MTLLTTTWLHRFSALIRVLNNSQIILRVQAQKLTNPLQQFCKIESVQSVTGKVYQFHIWQCIIQGMCWFLWGGNGFDYQNDASFSSNLVVMFNPLTSSSWSTGHSGPQFQTRAAGLLYQPPGVFVLKLYPGSSVYMSSSVRRLGVQRVKDV